MIIKEMLPQMQKPKISIGTVNNNWSKNSTNSGTKFSTVKMKTTREDQGSKSQPIQHKEKSYMRVLCIYSTPFELFKHKGHHNEPKA